jgi:3-hydroxyacyl-[acyl-carrier-protein] dehydratase
MPGVLVIEALAQTAAALVVKSMKEQGADMNEQSVVYFMSVDEAKFRKPIFPGSKIELCVKKERTRGTIWRFEGQAFVDGALCSEAIFTAKIV